MEQFGLFSAQRLPYKPFCVDWLGSPLRVLPLQRALEHRHLQVNPPHTKHWIVIDIDVTVWPLIHQMLDGEVPAANFLVINPENHHAHAFYALETPVKTGDGASAKALAYLADIESALVRALSGDPLYTGLIAKNPLHPDWQLNRLREQPYTLGELQDGLNMKGKSKTELGQEAREQGHGNNVNLFNALRLHAYERVDEFRQQGGWAQWLRHIHGKAEDYAVALDFKEIGHTAKSVATWVWKRYTGQSKCPYARARRAARGRRSAEARRLRAGSDAAFAAQMGRLNNKGITAASPWTALGISRATWYRRRRSGCETVENQDNCPLASGVGKPEEPQRGDFLFKLFRRRSAAQAPHKPAEPQRGDFLFRPCRSAAKAEAQPAERLLLFATSYSGPAPDFEEPS